MRPGVERGGGETLMNIQGTCSDPSGNTQGTLHIQGTFREHYKLMEYTSIVRAGAERGGDETLPQCAQVARDGLRSASGVTQL